MRQVTLNYRTNDLVLKEVPPPSVLSGCVLVRTANSAISLGTEGMKVTRADRGLLAMARERPDQVKQVLDSVKREGLVATYRKVMNRLDAPSPLGYSLSGTVIAVGEGVSEFGLGDRVACAGEGIAAHAEVVCVPRNLCTRVPDAVPLDSAAFATVGAIAMQGVRQSGISVGETVAVIGLGLVGQLALQIYRAAGCRVFGVDLDPEKCALAVKMGADHAVVRDDPHLEQHITQFSGGRGVDVVLITAATTSSDPSQLGVRLCRDRGTVVLLGIVGMEFQFDSAVKKEIQIRMSRSYGPGRYDPRYENDGIDYPIGYVRWTEQRNMESFLKLVESGAVRVGPIITDRFKFSDAEEAYARVRDRRSGHTMGVVFEYDTTAPLVNRVDVRPSVSARSTGQAVIGVIGAGNFARSTLLPNLHGLPGVRLRAIANATGLSARQTADKFGFEYCTTDRQELLDDPEVNCIVIATRHDLHGPLVIEAMRRGKTVFVEKPLALTRAELAVVARTQRETNGQVMVGFNRRFAPSTDRIRMSLENRAEPLVINYRVNAGYLPADHWLQDPRIGGGRIIGEMCHFIDWMLGVVRSPIVMVHAFAMDNAAIYRTDNVVAQLRFGDGSVGSLTYTANGDGSLEKEYVEVFGSRSVAVLNDYRSISFFSRGRKRVVKLGHQDKGHASEIRLFVEAVVDGKEMPIPFEQVVQATEASFAVIEAIASGAPVALHAQQ